MTDERLVATMYEARVRGGAAMITTDAAAVHSTAVQSGRITDATRDDCIPGYRKIVDAARGYECNDRRHPTPAGRR